MKSTFNPPTAHFVAALRSVAFNYYETKRDRNAAKRTRRSRKAAV
jgi:hypothetical protein